MRMHHKPPRVGLVTSYDKTKHAVKVQFQPEGTVSNWIGLTAAAVGNQFGIVSAPNIKDQVEVHFQEGDHMTARIMTRHFSLDADKPPQVEAGEHHLIHGSGSVLKFLKDGSVLLGGASTVTTGDIGKGQSGNLSTGNQGQTSDPNQQGTQQQPAKPNAKQAIGFDTSGNITITAINGMITITDKAGSFVIMDGSGNIQVKPVGGSVFLGGTGSDGTYGPVVTTKGPAANVLAKIS
jgi:hypothetical protein